MSNVPIITFSYVAIAFAITGFISFICAIYYSKQLSKYVTDDIDNKNVDIICVHVNKKQQQCTNAMFAFKILTLILFAASIAFISIFSYWSSTAKKYGAYDDYNRTETISSIKTNISKGFVDQSEELPESLAGCTIIFFKYGCNDCARIHDSLYAYLENRPVENLYFVSTRSERGVELTTKYGIPAVPAIAYNIINPMDNTPVADTEYIWDVIYNLEADETMTDVFTPETMTPILDVRDADWELKNLKEGVIE